MSDLRITEALLYMDYLLRKERFRRGRWSEQKEVGKQVNREESTEDKTDPLRNRNTIFKMGISASACDCFRALCCKGPPPPRPEYDLVCIGLSGAGKTSLLSKLCGESPENVVSTTGRSSVVHQWKKKNMDRNLGGGEGRPRWIAICTNRGNICVDDMHLLLYQSSPLLLAVKTLKGRSACSKINI
uniref:ADP-ribosylation factor-like protein 15 isoform X9 n=1 Tax=Phascolarctos cinereus TaxID=38626 RepID=A0A6P5LAR5_PHACI|nr:ADP-ribosylation factor-like protein 15 isoform X9 [Phascolarctos cinereus]